MNTLLITFLEEINPLGLLHIDTFLKDNGCQTTTLFVPLNPKESAFGVEKDRTVNDSEISEIMKLISEKGPGLIGISLMTIHYYSAVKLTEQIKKTFPDIPVVWGGIHPTLLPDECIRHADIVCIGEGEETLLELVRCMGEGASIENIQSLWVRSEDKIIRNRVRPLLQDLDSLGFPRFDWENNYILYEDRVRLLNEKIYQSRVPRNGRIYDVMSTRGCPYSCTYCCNSSFKEIYRGKGKLLRYRSIDNIIKELEHVKENLSFVKFINFQDDVFLVRKKDGWLENFCKEYKEKIGLSFMCKGSPREVTEENISVLKEAGMEYFHIGIQNSDRVNREIYKRATSSRDQVLAASEVLTKFGIVGRYDLILDDPFSTEEDALEVIDTLTKVKKPFMISCFSMTFFPNSEIYRMAEERNLLSKAKNGYQLKTTYAERNYLNNLVEICPRVHASVINFFVRHRKKRYAELLLNAYIKFHYIVVFRIMYEISKHPRLLSFAKDMRFRLNAARG